MRIGAEELIPLLTLSFSLYFRTPIEEDAKTKKLLYRDSNQVRLLLSSSYQTMLTESPGDCIAHIRRRVSTRTLEV
jgi:hypothetical protein